MSGTLFTALSDPGVDALLGAAQGFAQAAMPTRMPTPWGAVLGMGGAGALQGLQTSNQLQQGQQLHLLVDNTNLMQFHHVFIFGLARLMQTRMLLRQTHLLLLIK